ncbi:MAG: hypothetical protein V3R94_02700 [Acidobacteriota bacterium]
MLVAVLLLLVPTWSLAQEPEEGSQTAEVSQEESGEISLAELARRERERRARIGQPDRVITNANIGEIKGLVSTGGGGPSPVGEGDPTLEGEGEGESEEGTGEESGPDLGKWQSAFADAVRQLENAVNLGLVLELRMVDLNNSYFTATGPAQGEIQQQLQETREGIQENQSQVQAARQALRALESEAAMDGIPPGTIREMVGELPTRQSIQNTPGS